MKYVLVLLCLFACAESEPEPVKKSQDIVRASRDAGYEPGTDDYGLRDPNAPKPCDIEIIVIPDGDGGFVTMYRPVFCVPENIVCDYPDPK